MVLPGPVVVTRLVKVLLMKELKIAEGEMTELKIKDARLIGVAKVTSSVKSVLLRMLRGFGLGISAMVMLRSAKQVVTTPATRLRSVGVRFRSAGQRFRCQSVLR